MANANINVLGILNSVSADNTLARAEQIEITLEDGTKTKIPSVLKQYIKGVSSEEIEKFLNAASAPNAQIFQDQLFICTKVLNQNYKIGHLYYYDSTEKILSDITPATGSGSTSNISLNVAFRQEKIETNTEIEIPFTWTSKNTGFGFVYCLIDGQIKERLREQPGTSKWIIPSLERGNHQLTIYVVDSGDQISEKWEFYVSVGSLEISSSFIDSKIFKTGDEIIIPYEYYSNDTDAEVSLLYSLNSEDFIETTIGRELNLGQLPEGQHKIQVKIQSKKNNEIEYSNILKFSVLIATEGVLYASPVGDTSLIIKENEKISLMIKTTYIGAETFSVYFNIKSVLDNNDEIDYTETSIPAAKWVNGINSFLISFPKKGRYKIYADIVYTNAEVNERKTIVYELTVKETELYTIDGVADRSLLLHLSAENKNNNNLDKNTWKDTSVQELKNLGIDAHREPVNVKLHNFNFKSNGWIPDANGQSRLVIDSGAYAEIDLRPFLHEIGSQDDDGFTFEIEYLTKDILDSNARVVSCFNGQEGFWIDSEYATLSHNNSKTEIKVIEKKVTTDIVVGQDENGKDIFLTYTQFTQTGPFQTPFPSDTKNRITFVINRGKFDKDKHKQFGDYQFSCMSIYVNGVLTSVEKISDFEDLISTKFENNGQKIFLGCDNELKKTGYCEIYNIRAYNRALSMKEILINYASDIHDPQEKSNMIIRNDLRSDATSISDLPIMYFILKPEDAKRMSKKTKVWGKIDYRPEDNSKAFSSFMRCSWQGTSSLAYAVKNYKIKLYSTMANGKGDQKLKYDLGNGIKESTFCLKADYMDSAHMRNTGTANFVSDLGTESCPAQEYIPACRTAIYGFPILLYSVPPKDDTVDVNNLEPDFDKKELLGVFNFNLDKGCTDSLSLYTKKDIEGEFKDNPEVLADLKDNYPNWDCISMEGAANSDTTAGAFASIDDKSIFSDFELRFDDYDDLEEEGTEHHEGFARITDSEITISGINTELDDTYIIDKETNTLKGLRHDLVKTTSDLSTTANGDYEITFDYHADKKGLITIKNNSQVIYDETFELKLSKRYSHMKKLIRWVKDSSDDEFFRDFEKHFDLKGTVDYFLTVFVLLMADNLGKNCMWNTWGPISKKKFLAAPSGKYAYTKEEIRQFDNYIWVPQFYDMDTCLGLDNSGNMRFDVYEEIEPGIFNTSNSVFWTKFRRVFGGTVFGGKKRFDENGKEINPIYERYLELRSYSSEHSSFTTKSFLEYYYQKQIQKISERNYNFDTVQKYLKHPDYLFMCHGRQYEYFLRWIKQRLYFLDTIFEIGEEWSNQATVRVEYADFATKPIIFNIKTYQPAYVRIKFTASEDKWHKLKVPRNGEIKFEEFISTATDQEVILFNAGNIKSMGDISPYTPKGVILDKMVKLTELIVGTEEHPNPNLASISLAENTYLTKLVAENCTACASQVDVSKCKNLKYVSTKGSSINYVKLSESGGALEELHLSHATTTIYLSNFKLLRRVTIEDLTNLSTLNIHNCPLLTGANEIDKNGAPLLEPTGQDGTIFADIIDRWEPKLQSTSIYLNAYGKLTNFKFLDACSLLHEKYGLENRRITLGGKFDYLGSLIPNRYATYAKFFKNLLVTYNNVVDVSRMFKDYNNIDAIIKRIIYTKDEFGYITSTIKYYWRDPKENKFASYLEDGYRPIEVYDEDDQDIVAKEIKEKLSPFSRFTNMNEMFMNCEYIEKILPETFDKINVLQASTNSMFFNCKKLKYIECPKVSHLDAFAFNDCINATIWIPKTVQSINSYAFMASSYTLGKHSLLLFEDSETNFGELPYARDCRFNVKRNPNTQRALNREIISCDNITAMPIADSNRFTYSNNPEELCLEYFSDNKGKLVYNVAHYEMDGNEIKILNDSLAEPHKIAFKTWNIEMINIDELRYFGNKLNLSEMLYGSMKNFDFSTLTEMAIPPFNVINKSPNIGVSLYKEETNLLKLFYNVVQTSYYENLPKLKTVYLLCDKNNKITNSLFQDSPIENVYCTKGLEYIGDYAFKNSSLKSITYNPVDPDAVDYQYNLTEIGMYAFSNTKLSSIFVPDSVTYIDEGAYEQNQNLMSIQYSKNMEFVPIKCFSKCNIERNSPNVMEISGFSNKIRRFEKYAFDGSYRFCLVSNKGATDNFSCYWCCDNNPDISQRKFLDFFPDLEEIQDYAFRGIPEINKIVITPNIKYIGASSFSPKGISGISKTKLIWPNPEANYNSLSIEFGAFAGREFYWESNFRGFNDILEQTIYIPKTVGRIYPNAFAPSDGSEQSGARLRYVLTDAESKPTEWSDAFVKNELKQVYNYYSAKIEEDRAGVKSLYLLLKDKTAIYARLLNDGVSVEIPDVIMHENNKYFVKEIAEQAFYDNDINLNSIFFTNDNPKLVTIGSQLFKTENLTRIEVNNTNLYIPKAVKYIGKNTPFKQTSWFKNILSDDFVYLNNVCLGYSKNEKSLASSLESPDFKIKSSVETIYDRAFEYENITNFDLPKSLKYINKYAFNQCGYLTHIDFTPCQETLEYIGDKAFANNSKLKEMHYTKNIKHIGFGATSGCSGITKYIFDEGCTLDDNSQPFAPEIDITGFNTSITHLEIPASLGEFFSPRGYGSLEFSSLSNVKELILGQSNKIDLINNYDEKTGKYKINLQDYYPDAYYNENNSLGVLVQKPIIIETESRYFYAPTSNYQSDIDLSNLKKNLLDDLDIIRIVMGYKSGETHKIIAKPDIINRASASKYRILFNNRVTFTQPA